MKIRQKIAMLLAAAMTFTAMPMMTMAKSDFSLVNGIVIGKDDQTITGKQSLKIELKDNVVSTPTMFFVNIKNAKWKVTNGSVTAPTGSAAGQVQKNNDTEVQVTLTAGATGNFFQVPLDVELTGGEATVSVDGNGSVISDMSPVVFAKTSDDKATVTAGDAKNLYKYGVVADVTVEEPYAGILGTTDEIKFTLENTDYEFDFANITPGNFKLSRGFSALALAGTYPKVGVDNGQLVIKMASSSTVAPGRIKAEGLKIKAKNGKTPVKGDTIEITVSGEKVTETTVKVATSEEIGNTISMKDSKVVDVVAGKKKDVTFSIKENVDDSMIDGRTIEVRLDKAYFAADEVTSSTVLNTLANTIKGKANLVDVGKGAAVVSSLSMVTDKDDKVIGFDFTITSGKLRVSDIDELKFEDVTVYVPVDRVGDITVSAEGRVAIGDKISTVAINAKAPITTTKEEMTVKVGVKEQVGGKIVITETDKGMLQQGKDLVITFDKKDDGFVFTGKPTVTVVSGDVKFDLDKMDDEEDSITIPVSRASKTASVIEITGFKIKVDRTVPQGKFDIKLNGGAIEPDCALEAITVAEFLNVATPNTEDITTDGLTKGTSSFVVGSNKYVVNGVEATMDGAAYVANGRTMVPVRYVANALGVDGKNIYFASNTVTVVAGTKTISLVLGDKVAKIAGVPVRTMTAAPVLKDGRVYVPVSEIGSLLGVEATWDAATQTATFTNK